MKLQTITRIGIITSIQQIDNNNSIITDKVRLTNKRKQRAQNKANNAIDINNNMACKFMRVAQIERKKEKKQNFFNKHKK